MRYQISGKQIDVGEALQTHVKNELGAIVEKYAERPTDAHIIFSSLKFMQLSTLAVKKWRSNCVATNAG